MSDLKTVLGGKDVEIVFGYSDGGKPLTDIVRVRQLPLRRLGEMAVLSSKKDDEALVELYCDKEPGWAATLPVDTQLQLLEEGDALNFPNFQRYTKRTLDMAGKMTGAAGVNVEKIIEKVIRENLPSPPSA